MAAAAAARQARVDSDLRRRQKLAHEAAAAIISAEIEEITGADAEVDEAATVAVASQATEQANVAAGLETSTTATVIETQAAATRAAELMAAGGGDDGLQRRVAQRWLLKEFSRCTQRYR